MSSISTEIDRPHVDDRAADSLAEQATAHRERRLPVYFLFKDALDRILALLLLIPFLPVIGLLIILVRCTSKGSGTFRQVRVGRHGRNYVMLKLRSMPM